MRVFITCLSGVLLGWQFAGWLASGNWRNIPASILIPGSVDVQNWLYNLNPNTDWWQFLALVFSTPLWLVLMILAACSSLAQKHRGEPRSMRLLYLYRCGSQSAVKVE